MRQGLLAVVMVADSIVLALLGIGLVLAPNGMFQLFELEALPAPVDWIAGMWGALLLTLGIGYYLGSKSPWENRVLVQIGILRAVAETLLSLFYVIGGAITVKQGAGGLFLPVWFAIAYIVLYPRPTDSRTEGGH